MAIDIDILKPLKTIVETKNYNLDHVEFRTVIGKIITANKIPELSTYLSQFLNDAPDNFYASHLAIVVLSVYEKYLDKEIATTIASRIIDSSRNQRSYALASLLRICRHMGNYRKVEDLFIKSPELKNFSTFEVLYELTFFYNSKDDIKAIDSIISRLIILHNESIPIRRTTEALCIKYGLYEKYRQRLTSPPQIFLPEGKEFIYNEIEEEQYQKVIRSAALADLTNGIAHEFGQPLTNIRYGIQYYSKYFEKDQTTTVDKKMVLDFFKDVLIQTERIGSLIDRLSPITSTKSAITQFSLSDAIAQIFEQEKIRLNDYDINFELKSIQCRDFINFDYTQFNQIISNLLNNSIDTIIEKKTILKNHKGLISVNIKKKNGTFRISFTDNGTGINESDLDRIFNPFYTTKPPDKGQGLGLYIVSNILKMHGGNISVDRSVVNGAKFIIIIPQSTELWNTKY